MVGCAGRYVGKTVIITGGSKGIGEGCARVFFKAGANVVVCARGEQDGTALVAELNALQDDQRAVFVKADVSKVRRVGAPLLALRHGRACTQDALGVVWRGGALVHSTLCPSIDMSAG